MMDIFLQNSPLQNTGDNVENFGVEGLKEELDFDIPIPRYTRSSGVLDLTTLDDLIANRRKFLKNKSPRTERMSSQNNYQYRAISELQLSDSFASEESSDSGVIEAEEEREVTEKRCRVNATGPLIEETASDSMTANDEFAFAATNFQFEDQSQRIKMLEDEVKRAQKEVLQYVDKTKNLEKDRLERFNETTKLRDLLTETKKKHFSELQSKKEEIRNLKGQLSEAKKEFDNLHKVHVSEKADNSLKVLKLKDKLKKIRRSKELKLLKLRYPALIKKLEEEQLAERKKMMQHNSKLRYSLEIMKAKEMDANNEASSVRNVLNLGVLRKGKGRCLLEQNKVLRDRNMELYETMIELREKDAKREEELNEAKLSRQNIADAFLLEKDHRARIENLLKSSLEKNDYLEVIIMILELNLKKYQNAFQSIQQRCLENQVRMDTMILAQASAVVGVTDSARADDATGAGAATNEVPQMAEPLVELTPTPINHLVHCFSDDNIDN